MKKRLIPLLVLVLLLAIAPVALAHHCQRCKVDLQTGDIFCATSHDLPGFTWCVDDDRGTWCQTSGVQCEPHAFAVNLSADFTVASVERLDDDQPAANETLVAALPSHH